MELGPSTVVGVGLTLIGLILYFFKTTKPDVSRDYDLFFSSVGLLCGGILIFQGWRLDPILLLCQILSSATAIFFIGESLWLRDNQSKKKFFFSQWEIQDIKNKSVLSYKDQKSKSSFFMEKEKNQDMRLYTYKKNTFLNNNIKNFNHYSLIQKDINYQEKKLSILYELNKTFPIWFTNSSLATFWIAYGKFQFKSNYLYSLKFKKQKCFSSNFDYMQPIDYYDKICYREKEKFDF
jgi:hypothetical protein